MKKRIITAITILIILALYTLYDFLNVELHEVPTDELLSVHPSPKNDSIAKAYLIDEGGATVRATIRVEIKYGQNLKTIYWNYDKDSANIHWLDDETIHINHFIFFTIHTIGKKMRNGSKIASVTSERIFSKFYYNKLHAYT